MTSRRSSSAWRLPRLLAWALIASAVALVENGLRTSRTRREWKLARGALAEGFKRVQEVRMLRVIKSAALAVALTVLWSVSPAAAQPKSAEQIVFSTPGDFEGPLAPFGFWIWCQDEEAGNPYAGVCQGSMYFYDLGVVSHVTGGIEENADGTYTMTVVSTSGTPGSNVSCTLTNQSATPGPTNDVVTTCTAPKSGMDVTPNSVVVVTGP
jgi:hypothetical protein